MDTTVVVYGLAPGKGIGGDPSMTWSFAGYGPGVLCSTLIDPRFTYATITARKGPGCDPDTIVTTPVRGTHPSVLTIIRLANRLADRLLAVERPAG